MGNKVTNSNTSNKCFRCKNTTAQQSCNQCGHKFCNICFKSNSRSIPNVCLRCALCGDQSNPPTYSELMKIPNKDLLWLLSFSGYAVQHLVEKEAIVKEIIVEFNKFYNLPPINISTTILEDEIHQPPQQPSCSNDIPFGVSPPTYKDHMTKTSQINNAKQNEIAESKEPDNVCLWKPPANKLVKLEDLPNEEAIQLLSNKQLIGLLKENHLSKDCLERDEIINKIKFLFRSENENKIRQSLRNELSECISKQDKEFLDKFECKICMDAEIDCVLLECGHAVMCIKCAVNVNQCPICNQSIIRRVKMFRS